MLKEVAAWVFGLAALGWVALLLASAFGQKSGSEKYDWSRDMCKNARRESRKASGGSWQARWPFWSGR